MWVYSVFVIMLILELWDLFCVCLKEYWTHMQCRRVVLWFGSVGVWVVGGAFVGDTIEKCDKLWTVNCYVGILIELFWPKLTMSMFVWNCLIKNW